MSAGIIFNVSRSLAAHETIYNRTINHVFQSKESFKDELCVAIGGYCYNRILEFLFIASFNMSLQWYEFKYFHCDA